LLREDFVKNKSNEDIECESIGHLLEPASKKHWNYPALSIKDRILLLSKSSFQEISKLIDKELKIINIDVDYKFTCFDEINEDDSYFKYRAFFHGVVPNEHNVFFKIIDAKILSCLMMGIDPKLKTTWNDAHEPQLNELLNIYITKLIEQLTKKTKVEFEFSMPENDIINFDKSNEDRNILKIQYNYEIPGLLNSDFFHFTDSNFSNFIKTLNGLK
jgi:chemotaxis protein CheY-P-specific phosphatase CheC